VHELIVWAIFISLLLFKDL